MSGRSDWSLLFLVLILFTSLFVFDARGQTNSPTTASNTNEVAITVELLTGELNTLRERTDLEGPLHQQILTYYTNAVRWLGAAQKWGEEVQRFEQLGQAAEGEREVVKQELAQTADAAIEVPPDATLDSLRQQRDQAEADLTVARERLTSTEAERDQRIKRRGEIPAQLASLTTELEDVNQALAAAPPAGQAPELTRAMLMERLAKQRELVRQVEALRKELANYDARTDLMPLRMERATRRIAAREASLRAWRAEVDKRAALEAERQAVAARRAAAQAHPIVREIAESNVELVERRREMVDKIREYGEWGRRVESSLLMLAPQYEEDRRRLQSVTEAGLTDIRLRSRRDELTDLRVLAGGDRPIRSEINLLQRERFKREYEKRRLPTVEDQKALLLAMLPADTEESLRTELAAELEGLLTEQRSHYDELLAAFEEAERELIKVAMALEPLVALNREYRKVIDERVLWIRSMESIRLRDFPQAMALLGDILDPGDWIALLQFAWLNLQEDPAAVIGCLFVLLIWMSRRRQIRSRMTFLAEQVSKWTTDRFSYTIEVTVYSLLNALFWPAVLWMFAWRAGTAIQAGPLALQVASGLYRAGAVLFLFGLVFQIIRQSGLARTHFRWREDSRTLLRRHLNWVQPMIVPLAFVISAIDGFGSGTGESVLARMAFIAAMLIAAVFIMRLLRPQSGVFHHIIADSKGRWMERLQYVWYPVAVAIPLGLAVLAALGYFYTARQLEDRFLLTFTMVLGLMLTNQLALRWLYMARRALAIEEVRKRRRAAKEEVKESGTSMTDGEGGIITIDEKKLDISAVNNQTRKLVRSMLGFSFILGIWMIWAQMLPALGMLDRLVVWPNMEVRETVVTTQPLESIIGKDWLSRIPPPFQDPAKPFDRADAATLAGSDPAAVDSVVTVKNLILFLIIVLIIGVVSRNIPGLLEIAVLQKLPLEPSGRYAIVTLTRYVILVIGTVVSFGAIGIGWAQVQWLVAAITLGIGFGLQEIVANFISGIIILFEQPIRVGDTVTVNGVSGSVAKIRMRATTIVDWDRKELIIPNKSFITGDVINWTLSDPVLRLVINVGIAYGSDTQKAEEILLRIANEDPMVMSDPAPSVVFWEFGDSSLTFNLRVYLPHIGEMIRARHELHMNIDKAFREAGIEIAFPQRDIHIRSIVERASPTPDKGTVPPSVDDLLKGQAP